MAKPDPRTELLAEVVGLALDGGIAEASLREIAAAIGSSHRMLLYHFGSKEELLTAVTRSIEESERRILLDAMAADDDAVAFWEQLSEPTLWPQIRLFFELFARNLADGPGANAFLVALVDDWVEFVSRQLEARGVDRDTARIDARLSVAVTRGLLLDLLATGDRADVATCYRRFIELWTASTEND